MKKLELNSKCYIVQDKRFSTITIDIYYPFYYNQKMYYAAKFFPGLLMNYSEKYPEEQDYIEESLRRMIISKRYRLINYHNNCNNFFTFTLPDPKIVKSFDLEKAIDFIYDTIYHPKIINNSFSEENFQREKNIILNNIEETRKRPYELAITNTEEIIYNESSVKEKMSFLNVDLIKKITKDDVYETYQKTIKNNKPIIILYGNITKEVKKYIERRFELDNSKIEIQEDYNELLKPNKELIYKEYSTKDSQSFIIVGLKINNLTEKEICKIPFVTNIIKYNKLLYKVLREEKGLTYSQDISSSRRNGVIIINASINNNSKDLALEGITKVIDKLKNKEELNKYIKVTIDTLNDDLIRSKDSKFEPLDNFEEQIFDINPTLEETINYYNQISIDELIEFINRISIDTIYFQRGEFND